MNTVCFFARVKDRSTLDRVEFYAQDLQILSDLGYSVRIATSVHDLRPANLFFVWWWTWAFLPVSFARTLARPSIVTGTFDGWLFPKRPLAHRWLMQRALRMADANIFVSRFEMAEASGLATVNNPQYSPHCTFTDYFTPPADRRDPCTIFSLISNGAGNSERKSIRELIEAATRVARVFPSVRFLIGGDQGALRAELERLILARGIADNVRFLGALSREEKRQYMRTCTVYAQPSRYEGFGLAILEAMSCGAPVLSSRVGGVPEVGADAIAYADGRSPEAIAAELCRLLSDPGVRATMSAAARERATSTFSYERRRSDIGRIAGVIGA